MPRNDGYGDTEQENEPRKSGATHIRKSYALALVTALILYLLGLYTYPLLFPTTRGAASRQTPIAQQARIEQRVTPQLPDLKDLSVDPDEPVMEIWPHGIVLER